MTYLYVPQRACSFFVSSIVWYMPRNIDIVLCYPEAVTGYSSVDSKAGSILYE